MSRRTEEYLGAFVQMGVLQNVMVDFGDIVEGLSLRLDAPMNQQTNVTFANPPGGGTGPNTFALDVDLIFPSDGYYNFCLLDQK